MWVSPRQLALAGDFTVCHIRSEVEGDGRCAAEGGHVVGGNHVAAFDAERKHSLRGDHRHDVDAARNGVGQADDLARVGQVVDGDAVNGLGRLLGELLLSAHRAGRLDNKVVHPVTLEHNRVGSEVNDFVHVLRVERNGGDVTAERHILAALKAGKPLVNDCRSLTVVNGAGDENLVTHIGERPRGDEGNQGTLALADLNVTRRVGGSVPGDDLDACERASGGRGLGDGLSLEEGGAAVLVADDGAAGELGREVHEALDGGGVRHVLSLFLWCCPVDVSFAAGAVGLVFGGGFCPADNM